MASQSQLGASLGLFFFNFIGSSAKRSSYDPKDSAHNLSKHLPVPAHVHTGWLHLLFDWFRSFLVFQGLFGRITAILVHAWLSFSGPILPESRPCETSLRAPYVLGPPQGLRRANFLTTKQPVLDLAVAEY